MNFEQAIEALNRGEKVKLPEWNGYWFRLGNYLKVMTKEGDIIDGPFLEDYVNRKDFEITNGDRTFGGALSAIKAGKRLHRPGWNGGNECYVFLIGTEGSNRWNYTNGWDDNGPLLPFMALKTIDGKVVPWTPSQPDILAEDWQLV